MISDQTIQMFENYYNGLLSDDKKLELEEEFASNHKLRRHYESFMILQKAIEEEDKAEIEEGVKQSFYKSTRLSQKNKRTHRILKVVAAVAVLGLITWFGLLQRKGNNHEQLFAQYFELYPDQVSIMGDSSNQAALIACLEPYSQKKTKRAISCLEKLEESSPRNLYLAVSYLKEGKRKPALDLLLELEAQEFKLEVVNWYLALTHLSLDQKAEAQQYLKRIVSSKGIAFKKSRALELLNQMGE